MTRHQHEPVPGWCPAPDPEPSTLLHELEVDGELFAVRLRGTTTDYDWLSGPNAGYGFSESGSPDQYDEAEHRRSIRAFLDMIDPATGYIAED